MNFSSFEMNLESFFWRTKALESLQIKGPLDLESYKEVIKRWKSGNYSASYEALKLNSPDRHCDKVSYRGSPILRILCYIQNHTLSMLNRIRDSDMRRMVLATAKITAVGEIKQTPVSCTCFIGQARTPERLRTYNFSENFFIIIKSGFIFDF